MQIWKIKTVLWLSLFFFFDYLLSSSPQVIVHSAARGSLLKPKSRHFSSPFQNSISTTILRAETHLLILPVYPNSCPLALCSYQTFNRDKQILKHTHLNSMLKHLCGLSHELKTTSHISVQRVPKMEISSSYLWPGLVDLGWWFLNGFQVPSPGRIAAKHF